MKTPTSILIPTDWAETFSDLPDADAAALIRAAFAWNRGEDPELPPHIAPFAKLLKTTICRAAKKYSSTCYNHSEAARQRESEKRERAVQNCAEKAQESTTVNNKNKNKKENKNINTPHKGESRGGDEFERKILLLTDRLRIWFGRTKAATWSTTEISALVDICNRPAAISEYWEISRYYRSDRCRYPRRTILSLLQYWGGELDKARTWKSTPETSGLASSQQPTNFTKTQRGLGGLA